MRIIFAGDIVGDRALRAVCRWTEALNDASAADFIVVNAENAAEGSGLSKRQALKLLESGVDCITLGNHALGNWGIRQLLDEDERIIRPANSSPYWPGRGLTVLHKGEQTLAVFNLLGNAYMQCDMNPFHCAESMLAEYMCELQEAAVLLDFHAEATAEKQAMGRFLDGRVSAVLGTHTHVQTADDCILPMGTAYITDVGMCGPSESIIGMAIDQALNKLVKRLPTSYRCAPGKLHIHAAVIDLEADHRALAIRRLCLSECEDGEWMFVPPPIDF